MNELNNVPVLPDQLDVTIEELVTMVVTNTAADVDVPAQTLTYSLLEAPANAMISAEGVITWTPTEAQGPGTYIFITEVLDDAGVPGGSFNSFLVIVNEGNSAPVLPAQTDRTVNELTTVVVDNTASDSDVPVQTLSYSLLASPATATISANGVITWTPNEAQGPGTYVFTTRVEDNGVPPLRVTNTFSVIVNEVNSPPALPVLTERTLDELTPLILDNSAFDADLPAQTLNYTLLAAPGNATISDAGVITWTPNEVQGPGTYSITTRVTDSGSPARSVTNSVIVRVNEMNSAPVLPTQVDRTTNELSTLILTNTAADADYPVQNLTYTLLEAPSTAMVSADGVITWTPNEAQGPGTFVFTTRAEDNGVPAAQRHQHFQVVVNELNSVPALPDQLDRTIEELDHLTVTNTAMRSGCPSPDLHVLVAGGAKQRYDFCPGCDHVDPDRSPRARVLHLPYRSAGRREGACGLASTALW